MVEQAAEEAEAASSAQEEEEGKMHRVADSAVEDAVVDDGAVDNAADGKEEEANRKMHACHTLLDSLSRTSALAEQVSERALADHTRRTVLPHHTLALTAVLHIRCSRLLRRTGLHQSKRRLDSLAARTEATAHTAALLEVEQSSAAATSTDTNT